MADNLTITEAAAWPPTVKLIDTDEPVIGGEAGVSNAQAKTLANRSQWLKEQLLTVIELAELAPDDEDLAQLAAAIVALIAAGTPDALLKGKHEIPIPIDLIKPRASNPCGDIATLEAATYKGNFRYRAFNTTTASYGQFSLPLPKSWNGATIEFKYKWSHGATTTNFGVAFSLQAVSIADDEALDSAFGAAVTVADTGGTTDDRYWSAWSDPVTIAGAGEGEDQLFQIYRNVSDAGDNLAVDARLEGLKLRISFDKGNDA